MTPSCFFNNGHGLRAYHKGCEGRLQWHHPIEQGRLKRKFRYGAVFEDGKPRPATRFECRLGQRPEDFRSQLDILADPRNRHWLCVRHHELVSNHRIYIPRSAMESVEAFAREMGVLHLLDKQLDREAAA